VAGVSAARLRDGAAAEDRGVSPAGAAAAPRAPGRFRQELRDRFGPPPEPVEWLLRLAELRLLAARWHIASIHLEGKGVEGIGEVGLRSADSQKPVAGKRISRDGVAGQNGPPAFAKTGNIDVVLSYRNPRGSNDWPSALLAGCVSSMATAPISA